MRSTLLLLPSSTLTISTSHSRSLCPRLLTSVSFPRNYSLSCSSEQHSDSVPSTEKTPKENEEKCPPSKPMPTKDMTALQRHAAFFDRNHDDYIFPCETYQGCIAIGMSEFLAVMAAFVINITLSARTRPDKLPDLLFPIDIRHIDKAIHGSDSGIYDHGKFNEEKFEDMFKKYAHTKDDALTALELLEMLLGNMKPFDFQGWAESYVEWIALYLMCKDDDGYLKKDVIKSCYDGSLFETMAREHMAKKKKKVKHG